MKERVDVAIIGGGAAGLAAAIFLKRRCSALQVAVLERGARVGRKLLSTGNGTCNISNIHASPAYYHGGDVSFVKPALAAFPPHAAMAFFDSIGVICRPREDGRVYPVCEQAAAVLDCLRAECAALGVEEVTEAAVSAICLQKRGFVLETAQGALQTKQVLVTAGGAASPSLGGVTDGYALLAALGHEKTPLFPAVTQICAESEFLRAVKGLRADVCLTLETEGNTLAQSEGELLFCDYGLSGPAALAISRVVGDWERKKQGVMTAVVDLLPSWDVEVVMHEVRRRTALGGRTAEDMLTGLLNKRIGQTVMRAAGVLPLSRAANSLTEEEIAAVASLIKGWRFAVRGTKGLAAAQVTAGGIATVGFDPKTMRSRRVAGLYAAGEVLDIDGDCGGFNLQWAWSSARAAAEGILAERRAMV